MFVVTIEVTFFKLTVQKKKKKNAVIFCCAKVPHISFSGKKISPLDFMGTKDLTRHDFRPCQAQPGPDQSILFT